MNIGVHVSFQNIFFSRSMPRSAIVGAYGSSISTSLRNLHTLLHSGCANLHSHQQYYKGSPFSTLSLAFIICRLFDDGLSYMCRAYHTCVLICISLTISNVEHLFMVHWSSVYVLWGSIQIFCLFFIGLFALMILSYIN